MKSSRWTRRRFLTGVGHGMAALSLFPAVWSPKSAQARVSPNDKIVIGLVGCGGMGNAHLRGLLRRPDAQIAAVCDVFIPRYTDAVEKIGDACKGYQDYRRVLEREDIDAVFFATPDHWHTLNAIHACEAGKDVYVEKPLSTTIYEGRKIVEAARRYNRVVQVGLQQRSLDTFQEAVELVQEGKLGTVTAARVWISPNGIGAYETPQNPPEGLDWELWLGPAPWVPYSPQRFGGFRAFHDYAGGELTNWGPHLMDVVHWGIEQDRPHSIQALGGSYCTLSGADDYECMEILYEFSGCTVTWQQAHGIEYAGKSYGTMFMGTEGKLMIDRISYIVQPDTLGIPERKPAEYDWINISTHHDNFFECIRTRKRPHTDVEIGHRSTSTCLLGNIALDCRRKLLWDGEKERFINDEAANRHLFRPYRAPWHL